MNAPRVSGDGTADMSAWDGTMREKMPTKSTALTAITQGRGSFRIEMSHYDLVPQLIAEKILAAAKQPLADEEEE